MKVGLNESDRDVGIEVVRRDNIQNGNPGDFVGMIESHAMRDSSAAIVADNWKRVVAEMLHYLDLVQRHRSLRVVRVIVSVRRLAAVTVTAKIRRDDGVTIRKFGRNESPCDMRKRSAVQQEQRWSLTAGYEIDHCP